jgi:hypothetical protein
VGFAQLAERQPACRGHRQWLLLMHNCQLVDSLATYLGFTVLVVPNIT